MKPFRFSLQPLRTIREHRENAARERYAGSLQACEAAAAQMQSAAAELTGCWSHLTRQLSAGVSGNDLLRARAWCNVLELRVKERAAALEEARQALDEVWHDLLRATRDRETVDRLYAKRRNLHRRDCERAEQKQLDEIALQLTSHPAAGSDGFRFSGSQSWADSAQCHASATLSAPAWGHARIGAQPAF